MSEPAKYYADLSSDIVYQVTGRDVTCGVRKYGANHALTATTPADLHNWALNGLIVETGPDFVIKEDASEDAGRAL